jgi:hypothetical protein
MSYSHTNTPRPLRGGLPRERRSQAQTPVLDEEQMIWMQSLKQVGSEIKAKIYLRNRCGNSPIEAKYDVTVSEKKGPRYETSEWSPCTANNLMQAVRAHSPLKIRLNSGSDGRVPILPDHMLLQDGRTFYAYRRRSGHSRSRKNFVKSFAVASTSAMYTLGQCMLSVMT